jgi:hypothetical protein
MAVLEEAAARTRAAEEAEAAVARAEDALRDSAGAQKEAEARNDEAVSHHEHAERDHRGAEEAVRLAREKVETAALTERLRTARATTASMDDAVKRLEQEPVTAAEVDSLLSLEHHLAVAVAGAEAAATTLTLEGLRGQQTVTLNGDTLSLEAPGASTEHQVAHGAELIVGDVRLRVEPHPDAVRCAERRDDLQSQLQGRLRAVGCADVSEARERSAARERLGEEVEGLRRQLAAALDGLSLQELAAAVTERAGADVADERIDLDAFVAEATQCALRAQEARQASEATQRELTDRTRARLTVERTHALARAQYDVAETELARVRATLAEARARADDETVSQAVAEHREALTAARARLAQAEKALADVGADELEAALATAQSRLSQTRESLEQARAEFHDVKGRLEVTAAEGRHEARERAEQQLDDARRRYDSVERRARAARQLHTTLQRHRSQAHDWYAAPYARAIERLGAAVYGESFGVTVDSRLAITHRWLHGVRVPFEQLSGGAAEQLGILARLAVASLIDPDHCAPVVIDDALGFTDPERLQGLGRVFSSAGQEHAGQIIVLTCTPQRYDAVQGAHRVALGA